MGLPMPFGTPNEVSAAKYQQHSSGSLTRRVGCHSRSPAGAYAGTGNNLQYVGIPKYRLQPPAELDSRPPALLLLL